ncbi:hypothetical protein Q0590_12730 [Rhodocytophaga aerolata]|uniref:Transposase n=1 Tax=Rhodocytophaga aerolata TaxID=455078 RepID=A0ABT8R4V6_9BACT|nr:hypothetical protein [Rhodocytophaga aerolata]MDO1447126.1 hypothetical protein [Rhodocytophaga aerolata]
MIGHPISNLVFVRKAEVREERKSSYWAFHTGILLHNRLLLLIG